MFDLGNSTARYAGLYSIDKPSYGHHSPIIPVVNFILMELVGYLL